MNRIVALLAIGISGTSIAQENGNHGLDPSRLSQAVDAHDEYVIQNLQAMLGYVAEFPEEIKELVDRRDLNKTIKGLGLASIAGTVVVSGENIHDQYQSNGIGGGAAQLAGEAVNATTDALILKHGLKALASNGKLVAKRIPAVGIAYFLVSDQKEETIQNAVSATIIAGKGIGNIAGQIGQAYENKSQRPLTNAEFLATIQADREEYARLEAEWRQQQFAAANQNLNQFLAESSGDASMSLEEINKSLDERQSSSRDVVDQTFVDEAMKSADQLDGPQGLVKAIGQAAQASVGQPVKGMTSNPSGIKLSPELEEQLKGINDSLIPMFSQLPNPEQSLNAALAGIGTAHGLTLDEMKVALAHYQAGANGGKEHSAATGAMEKKLRLQSGEVSTSGRNVVAVALVESELRVVIFDSVGRKTSDIAEPDITAGQEEKVAFLKNFLQPLQSVENLDEQTQQEIIQTAESLDANGGLVAEIEETRALLQSFDKLGPDGRLLERKYAMEMIELEHLEREAVGNGVWLNGDRMKEDEIRKQIEVLKQRALQGLPSQKLEFKFE